MPPDAVTVAKSRKIPEQFRRGPDRRSDLERTRKRRLCKEDPNCEYVGKTDWRKGFCTRHATAHGFQDPNPKRSHHAKKLKVKDVMRKLKLKLKAKPKLKLKKAEAARVAARAAMESDSEPDVVVVGWWCVGTWSKHSPVCSKHSPVRSKHSPALPKHSPVWSKHSPVCSKHKPV